MKYGVARALPGDHIAITMDTCTAPFWEAAKEHRLTAAQCVNCGHFRMPPKPFCPECLSRDLRWPSLPGTGTVFSFAICTRSPFPGSPDLVYVPVVVDLDGAPGARLVSNLVGIPAEDVEIGMKVRVAWLTIQEGWELPIFEKA